MLVMYSSLYADADPAVTITPPLGIEWSDGFSEVLAKVKALKGVSNVETLMVPQVFWSIGKTHTVEPNAVLIDTPIGRKYIITTGFDHQLGPRIEAHHIIISGAAFDLTIQFDLAPELAFTKPASCLVTGGDTVAGLMPTHIELRSNSPATVDAWNELFLSLKEKYKDAKLTRSSFSDEGIRSGCPGPSVYLKEYKGKLERSLMGALDTQKRLEIRYENRVDVTDLYYAFARRLLALAAQSQRAEDDLLNGL